MKIISISLSMLIILSVWISLVASSAGIPTGSSVSEIGSVEPVNTYQNPYPDLGNISLWIGTSHGRMQYAIVPQYSDISLIASTSLGGQGIVYELYPITTGQGVYALNTSSFNPGDNQLGFNADVVGRHILFFSINNQASNAVIVDVQGGIDSLELQRRYGTAGSRSQISIDKVTL